MIDDLIEYFLDVLYEGTKHLKAERKLQKLQKEGIDRYKWIVRGINVSSYPCSDQVYGILKFLINHLDYKPKNESPQQYIESIVQEGRIIRDGRNIIVKKGSIELNFEIEGEKMLKGYERFTSSDSEREDSKLDEVIGNVEVRYHELHLMYKGWNLKTNLLVGTDQFLQKPFEIKFLNEK